MPRTAPRALSLRIGLSLLAGLLTCGPALAGDGANPPQVAASARSPAELEQAFASAPSDVVKGMALSDAWVADGKREQALKYFRARAAERKSAGQPEDLVLGFLVGRLEGGEASCAAMWAAVRGRLGLPEGVNAGLPEALDALAVVEEREGRLVPAATALEQRVALAPAVGAWMRLGWLREQSALLVPAEQAYRQARALAPENGAARNALVLVLARLPGKSREARKLADEGVQKEPASASAWLHLGLVKSLAGDAPGAVAAYGQAFERAQKDAATLTALGAAYGELEQWDLAQKALAAAVALDAERAEAVLQAAAIAVQREQWADAKKLLAQAARLSPKDAQVAFLQGVVLQRTQQLEGAIAAYRKAIGLDPKNAGYALALVGAILERGNLDAAVQALTEAAQRCPENAGIQLRLGFVLMQKKRWAQAADAFRAAARLDPKDPDPQLYLAVILGDHQDQPDQARLHLERYKELGGKEPSALAWLTQLTSQPPVK